MATAPYGVRLLVGAAATAIEETRKLPQTILMYPMTVVSQLAHLVMKVQQDVADADPPDIVAELDYESLTLAQLRARLSSLRIADLEALLAYEDATKSRAPFQTLLANRITRATAK